MADGGISRDRVYSCHRLSKPKGGSTCVLCVVVVAATASAGDQLYYIRAAVFSRS